MKKALGNVDPTADERQRMLAVLDGLRERFNARGIEFAAASFHEADGTAELYRTDGGRAAIVAWINSGRSRQLFVWRHEGYRDRRDEQYIFDACAGRT